MVESTSPMRMIYLLVAIVGAVLAAAYHLRQLILECAHVPLISCLLVVDDPRVANKTAERRERVGDEKHNVRKGQAEDANKDGEHKTHPSGPYAAISMWHNPRSPQNTYSLQLSGKRATLTYDKVAAVADNIRVGLPVFVGDEVRTGEYKGKHYAYAPKANNCPPFASEATLTVEGNSRLVLRGRAWAKVAFGTCEAIAAEAYADEYSPLR